MSLSFERFDPMRRAEEYVGVKGDEVGGMALDFMTLALIERARKEGRYPSGVWIDGRYVRDDGVSFLSVRLDPPAESGRDVGSEYLDGRGGRRWPRKAQIVHLRSVA